MKLRKLTSFLCAAALTVSSIAGLSVSVSADEAAKNVTVAVNVGDTTAKVTSGEAEELTGVLIHAKYTENVLESVNVSSEFTTPQNSVDIGFAYAEGDKLFVWNSLSGMVPYKVTVIPNRAQINTVAKVDISGDATAPATLTATVSAINDSGFEDTTAFTYEWKKGEETLPETGATLADAVEGNYTVTATYTGTGNYEGSVTTASPYIVSPAGDTREDIAGKVTVSINADKQTAGATLTASISAGETDLSEDNFTYVWSKDSSPISGGENGTLEDAQAGDYTVVATVKSDNESYKGSTAASQTVTIKAVYTVTFNTDGGSSVNSAQVTDGDPVAQPETPTKEHYDFAGWYKETSAYDFGTPVTDNITLRAHWTIKQYTVTFDTDGGNAIQAVTQDYNTTITLPTPTRDGYTFVKWNDGATDYSAGTVYTIAGDITITASWTENQADTYTVRWLDDDNSELYKDENIASGTATPTHPDPAKAESEQYTYTFAGWTPTVAATVTGNAEYKATYTPVAKQFDVTYTTTHGTAPTDVKYTYGVGIADLPALTDDNYNLVGWYSDEERTQAVTSIGTLDFGKKTLYAKWQAKTPDISVDFENEQLTGFAADGSYTIDGNDVEPTEGKLAADGYIGQTISIVKKATSPDIDSAAQSLAVDARPDAPTGIAAVKRSALQADGQITGVTTDMEYKLSTDNTWIKVTATPITGLDHGTYYVRKAATETAFASENATVTVETQGSATVIFKNYDDTVLKSIAVAAGNTPSYDGETPTKDATAEYTYTFSGWTPTLAEVEEGHDSYTYTATYNETKNKYTITWVDYDDNGIRTDAEQEYGTAISAPNDPTRAATDEYTYTFAGWTPEVAETVTDNATYKATYNETKNKYTITWNIDGTETSEQLDYGTTPSHEAPSKAATAQYTYTFKGWSTTSAADAEHATTILPEVTAATTYYAVFEQTTNTYTVTWKSQDGNSDIEVDTDVEYGTAPSFDSAAPTKDAAVSTVYTFAGWATEENQTSGETVDKLSIVTGNATYYAAFSESVRTYKATFNLNGGTGTADEQDVSYNGTVETPQEPTKTGYDFNDWLPALTTPITEATEFTAQWTAHEYTITYNNTDDATGMDDAPENYTIETEDITLPTPEKDGFEFAGWYEKENPAEEDTAVETITKGTTGDKTFYAKWTEDGPATVSYTTKAKLVAANNEKTDGETVFQSSTEGTEGTEVTVNNLPIVIKEGESYYVLNETDQNGFKHTATLTSDAEQTVYVEYTIDPTIVDFVEGEKFTDATEVDAASSSGGKAARLTSSGNYARIVKDYTAGNTYELTIRTAAKNGSNYKLKDNYKSASGVVDIGDTANWTCEAGTTLTELVTVPSTGVIYICANGGTANSSTVDIDYAIIRTVPDYTVKAVTSAGADITTITTGITKLTTEVSGLPHVVKDGDSNYYVLTDTGITDETHTKVFVEPVTSAEDVIEVEYTLDETIIAYAEGENTGTGTGSGFANANKKYSGGNSGAVTSSEFYTFDGIYNETTVYNLEFATVNRANKDIMLKATSGGTRIKIKEFVSGVEQAAADKMNITTNANYVGAVSKDIRLDYTTNGISQRTLGIRSPNNGDITPISDYIIIREALSVSIAQNGTNVNAVVTPAAASVEYKWEEKNSDGTYTQISTDASIPFADYNGKTIRLTVTRNDGKYAESSISNTTADYLVGITGAYDEENSKYVWTFGNSLTATTKGTEIAATNGNEYADLKLYLGVSDSITSGQIHFSNASVKETSTANFRNVNDTQRYFTVTPKVAGTLDVGTITWISRGNNNCRIYYKDITTTSTELSGLNKDTADGYICSTASSDSEAKRASTLDLTANHTYVFYTYQVGSTISSMTFTPTAE